MLSQEEIQMFTVSVRAKLGATYTVHQALDELDAVLRETIYDYMPMSADDEWQDEADKVFWNSEGMHEINDVDCAIRHACELTLHAIHLLEHNSQSQATILN